MSPQVIGPQGLSWFRQGLDLRPPTGFRPRLMERRFRRYTNAAGQERLVVRLDPLIFPDLSETERTFEVEDWVDGAPGDNRGRLYMLKSMLDGTVSQPIYHASSFALWDDVPTRVSVCVAGRKRGARVSSGQLEMINGSVIDGFLSAGS